MKYLTYKELSKLSSEEAREFIDDTSNDLLSADEKLQKKIKNYFIDLLLENVLYETFSFEEVVKIFMWESHLFDNEDKENILKHITEKFKQFCESKNEMVSFILLDFISREINKTIRKKYVHTIKEKYKNLDIKDYKRCLDIIENGFFDQDNHYI